MAADIYTLARGIMGDSTSPYVLPDIRLLKYLDKALDKLSEMLTYTVVEDITISSTDITNGYVDVTSNIFHIQNFIAGENESWEVYRDNRIRFIRPSDIAAGTYEITYRAYYKRFDGAVRDNSYFDYPRAADLAVVFYALALYQQENGVINADGSTDFIRSKTEEGLSVSYGTLGAGDVTTLIGHPVALQIKAVDMMRSLPNSSDMFVSVQI